MSLHRRFRFGSIYPVRRATIAALEERRLLASQLVYDSVDRTNDAFEAAAPGAAATGVMSLGARAVFTAAMGGGRVGLWSTDGTPTGTVQLLGFGASDATLASVTPDRALTVRVGNDAIFAANSPAHGLEVWASDGTIAGTRRLTDFAGSTAPLLTSFSSVPATIGTDVAPLPVAYVWTNDQRLFTINPTSGQVTQVATASDPAFAAVASTITQVAPIGAAGKAWFNVAATSTTPSWVYLDPATGGGPTPMNAPGFVNPRGAIANADGTFSYVAVPVGSSPAGVYRTNGTAAGTTLQFALPAQPGLVQPNWSLLSFVRAGDTLWVRANATWWTNFTQAGTRALGDAPQFGAGYGTSLRGIADGSILMDGVAQPGRVTRVTPGFGVFSYVVSQTPTTAFLSGTSVYAIGTQGIDYVASPGGTSVRLTTGVADSTAGGSWLSAPAQLGAQLVVGLRTLQHGLEPHVVGSTAASVTLLRDVNTTTRNGFATNVMPVGSAGVAFANNFAHLIVAPNGTPSGAFVRTDIRVNYTGSDASRNTFWTQADGRTYFSAIDSTNALRIAVTDGTDAGTRFVGPSLSTFGRPVMLHVLGGKLLMASSNNAGFVGSLDLTTEQFVSIANTNVWRTASPFVQFGNHAYFVNHVNGSQELWRTDGTAAGTSQVVDVTPGITDDPRGLFVLDGRLYFNAMRQVPLPGGGPETGPSYQLSLFSTDGTAVGTTPIVFLGSVGGLRQALDARPVGNGRFVFPIESVGGGLFDLMATDGTAAGTSRIDFGINIGNTYIAASEGRLYYFDGAWNLSVTQGTAATTVELPLRAPTGLSTLAAADGNAYFLFDPVNSSQSAPDLWASDGTPAGTRRIEDIDYTFGSNTPRMALLGTFGDHLYYYGSTAAYGMELMRRDVVAPRVTSAAYRFDDAPPVLRVTFGEPLAAPPVQSDVVLRRLDGTVVASSEYSIAYDDATRSLELQPTSPLPDGRYEVSLARGALADTVGNRPREDVRVTFFVLAGDANRDAVVNFDDLLVLAANYNQGGRTFSQGDFNYDGTVNFDDLLILASRYNTSLPALTLAAPGPQSGAPTPKAGAADGDEDPLGRGDASVLA
jgi:ELWxxDGT repeat protein